MEGNIIKSDLYSELNIIISHQSILQMKTGILLTINTIFVSLIISLSLLFSLYILLVLLFFPFVSIMINIYILWPNFARSKKENKKGKYFYDFANMEVEDLKNYFQTNEEYLIIQIQKNSQITSQKYKLFKKSLGLNFLLIPFIIDLFKNEDR